MASSDKTPTIVLSQFIGTDKPTWLTDYNGDMLKIDTAIAGQNGNINQAAADAAEAKTQAAGAASQVGVALNTAEDAKEQAAAADGKATNAQNAASQASIDASNAVQQVSGAVQAANAATAAVAGITDGWVKGTLINPNPSVYTTYEINYAYNASLSQLYLFGRVFSATGFILNEAIANLLTIPGMQAPSDIKVLFNVANSSNVTTSTTGHSQQLAINTSGALLIAGSPQSGDRYLWFTAPLCTFGWF